MSRPSPSHSHSHSHSPFQSFHQPLALAAHSSYPSETVSDGAGTKSTSAPAAIPPAIAHVTVTLPTTHSSPFSSSSSSSWISSFSSLFTSSRLGAIFTLIVIGVLFLLFLISATSTSTTSPTWLMLVSQLIIGSVAAVVMFVWRASHRTGDKQPQANHLNDIPPISTLISRFGVGCIVGLLFTALMFGEYILLAFVTTSVEPHPDYAYDIIVFLSWTNISVIIILAPVQFWLFMLKITSSDAKAQAALGTRAQMMNSSCVVVGASTSGLYVLFTLWARIMLLNVDAHGSSDISTTVLLPTLMLAVVLLPLDTICSEYISLRMAVSRLVPAVYGSQRWYYSLIAPIIVRVLVLAFVVGMLIVQIYVCPWSTTVPVFLGISWLVFIFPFAYVVRGWRRVWSAEVAALRPVELSGVQVQGVVVPQTI